VKSALSIELPPACTSSLWTCQRPGTGNTVGPLWFGPSGHRETSHNRTKERSERHVAAGHRYLLLCDTLRRSFRAIRHQQRSSATDVANLSNRIYSYMTALGINVY
jgi:hypothetical protein